MDTEDKMHSSIDLLCEELETTTSDSQPLIDFYEEEFDKCLVDAAAKIPAQFDLDLKETDESDANNTSFSLNILDDDGDVESSNEPKPSNKTAFHRKSRNFTPGSPSRFAPFEPIQEDSTLPPRPPKSSKLKIDSSEQELQDSTLQQQQPPPDLPPKLSAPRYRFTALASSAATRMHTYPDWMFFINKEDENLKYYVYSGFPNNLPLEYYLCENLIRKYLFSCQTEGKIAITKAMIDSERHRRLKYYFQHLQPKVSEHRAKIEDKISKEIGSERSYRRYQVVSNPDQRPLNNFVLKLSMKEIDEFLLNRKPKDSFGSDNPEDLEVENAHLSNSRNYDLRESQNQTRSRRPDSNKSSYKRLKDSFEPNVKILFTVPGCFKLIQAALLISILVMYRVIPSFFGANKVLSDLIVNLDNKRHDVIIQNREECIITPMREIFGIATCAFGLCTCVLHLVVYVLDGFRRISKNLELLTDVVLLMLIIGLATITLDNFFNLKPLIYQNDYKIASEGTLAVFCCCCVGVQIINCFLSFIRRKESDLF